MRPVYVLGVGAHPWGKFPDRPQLQMALQAAHAALADAGLAWRDLQGLVAASSRFEGGMGWGLHANEMVQAVCESGIPACNVGGGCAAGGIAVHTAWSMMRPISEVMTRSAFARGGASMPSSCSTA